MHEIPQSLFDVYALALPRGHGFGNKPPIGAWQSEDGMACGIVLRDDGDGSFGILIMRRRMDHVWIVTAQEQGLPSLEKAKAQLKPLLKEGTQLEPMPPNTAPRATLHDLNGRTPSDVFRILSQPSHHVAEWLLNQLYLSLPNPDKNWAGDCQTDNFHTRLWEAQLLASFREQGLLVTQPHVSPDFRVENKRGGEAWVEAVTANPAVRYNPVNAPPSRQPESHEEHLLGPAAVRFAKTLGNKLGRRYDKLTHVSNKPFMIALADFHAPASMIWTRESLISYLYGMIAEVTKVNGRQVASARPVSHLLGASGFPAGLFCNGKHSELSAIIFSNACSIAKLNRVGISKGMAVKGHRCVRIGNFFDRTPGALKGIPFCLDVTSPEYRALWPQGYEPWSAELEVFHNPHAQHPVPRSLLPEAMHWFEKDGEMICEAHYQTSVLWSQTLIQNDTDQMPTLEGFDQISKTIE